MKYNLFGFALLFCVIDLAAQTEWIQNTTVREQNSNKTPVSNAQVFFDGAPANLSGQDGKVRLAFSNKKPGAYTFLLKISKDGYELVNKTNFENIKLSANDQLGTDIILAKTGTLSLAKKEYYDISDRLLKAGFEEEKAKIHKQRDEAKITAKHFEEQWKQLQVQYDKKKQELDPLAEKFARINFDDVESQYRMSLELFKVGKIDAAIQALESANPVKHIEEIIRQERQYADDPKKLNAQKRAITNAKQSNIAQVILLANMYWVKFNSAKAETLIDNLLLLDSTDLTILRDAADFYEQSQRYDRALHVLPLIIAHPQAEDWQKANAYGQIGDIYTSVGQLEPARQAYQDYQKAYAILLQADSASFFYKNILAISYSRLGETHMAQGNLAAALRHYEEYNRLKKELYEANPSTVDFKNGLVISYSRLGETHTALGNLDKALIFFERSHQLNKELYEVYPSTVGFKNSFAISYSKLGETYAALGNLTTALQHYEEYNRLEKELYETYPTTLSFKNDLAISFSRLGEMQTALGNLTPALRHYEAYNQLKKELYETFPTNVSFKNGLAISYSKLGDMHNTLGNLDKALTFYKERARLGKELYDVYPTNMTFKNGLAISYSKIGDIYSARGNWDTVVSFYEECNRLQKELYAAYPTNVSLKNDLAISFEKLGDTYSALGNLEKALNFYNERSRLGKELYDKFPTNVSFKNGLAISYLKLGEFSRDKMNDKTQARKYLLQAETLWSELVRDAPQTVQFQRLLDMVRERLAALDKTDDPVLLLESRIQNESDTLAKYQIYSTLCDTLRRRSMLDLPQKTALAEALNARAWYGFFLQKFEAGEADIREGLGLHPENKYLPSNLAPALLLQGKKDAALAEYNKWKEKPFGEYGMPTYREIFLSDLVTLEKAGIIPAARMEDVAAVRKILLKK